MKNALIITWENFTDQEVFYPYYRLQEEGFKVEVMANAFGSCSGINNIIVQASYPTNTLKDKKSFEQMLQDFDLLIIPGGVRAIEKLRQQKTVIEFIQKWNETGKVIGAMCHGCQMLISAGCCIDRLSKPIRSRHISGYYSIVDDVENAGGIYHREPVVDDNIVSGAHYKDLPEWMRLVLKVYNERNTNNK